MWLDRVKVAYGDNLEIIWKFFSLDQANSKQGPKWKIWDQPEGEQGRSLLSMRSGEAARRQGDEAFEKYHLALLKARHGGGDRIVLNEAGPLIEVARTSGLDVAQFQQDLLDTDLIDKIVEDHTEAVEEHGVFGTPTFVFASGNSVYLKTFIPPEEESVEFFRHFVAIMADRSYVGELKRPQPPWPKGVV